MDQNTHPAVEAIKTEIKRIEEALIPQLQKQSEEIRKQGETSMATSKAIKELEAKYDERLQSLDEALTEIKQDAATKAAIKPGAGAAGRASAGAAFIESDEYKAAVRDRRESTSPVEVKSFFTERKTLFTDGSLGTGQLHLYEAFRQPGIVDLPAPDLHIRDLLPVTPIDRAIVEYVERTNGRWVADVQESEGDLKKEQALAFAVRQAGPVTIAHWLPVTNQVMNRAPQLRSYIDRELVLGVRLAEDEQLLYGDGSSGNLQGLMTNTNVQTYNRGQSGDTRIDTIRRAVTQLRNLFYRPTGVVVHPNDWEAIELQKDKEERYLWVSVTDGGVPRLWRVPVVDTPAIEEDSFLLGDFSMGANLWDLEAARVRVGWINDDFVRNRQAILGEEDIIFTTEHPKAFVKGDFGAVSS